MMSLKKSFYIFSASKRNFHNSFQFFSNRNEYKLVYSCPYVRVGSLVNKLKYQQTIFTGIGIPISAALEYQNFVNPGLTLGFVTVGVAMNAAIYGVGQLFNKLIGKVYFNEKDDVAKFAYVGFSGQRLEIEVPRGDIVLPNIDDPPGFLYTKIQIYDTDLVLKLSEKHFDYCDLNLARKLFGESFQRTERS